MSLDNNNDESLEESLDLRQYISLFWNWGWLIVLAGVVAGAAAFFFSKRMTPYYQSATSVLVNEAPATKTTDYSSVMMSQQLTSTYAQMMAKDPVLSEVITQLGLDMTTTELGKLIKVTPVQNTQLIAVTTETTDPQLSADIANAVATVFARQIQEIQSQRFAQSKATLEGQLEELEKEIATYETQAGEALTADEKTRLDAKVTQYREIYSGVLTSYESVRLSEAQSVSSVTQVETAKPAEKPIRPKVLQNTMLAAVVGMMLAAGGIFVRESLDDTIKTPEEIGQKLRLPILGVINHQNGHVEQPITMREPKSPTSEAYRSLRTNVSYTHIDHPLKSIMVTSSEPGEGKTTTLANLAVVCAQNGKHVIAADCDLRHPRLQVNFRLNNRKGLSNLFTENALVLDGSCQVSGVENLVVVTTGSLPPNPAELLGSQKMEKILAAMSQAADMVLVDSPPILAVTDAVVLAPMVDGVLLVVRPGKTRMSALKRTLELLSQVKANVLGVVLNDVSTHRSSYSYHYKYYRNYSAYQKYYGEKDKVKGKK